MTRNKKITVRLNEKEEKALEVLKNAINEQHHLDLTDSDVIRQALSFLYNSSIKESKK